MAHFDLLNAWEVGTGGLFNHLLKAIRRRLRRHLLGDHFYDFSGAHIGVIYGNNDDMGDLSDTDVDNDRDINLKDCCYC